MTSERPITSTKTPTILERSSTQSFLTPFKIKQISSSAISPNRQPIRKPCAPWWAPGPLIVWAGWLPWASAAVMLSQIPNLVRLGSLGIDACRRIGHLRRLATEF